MSQTEQPQQQNGKHENIEKSSSNKPDIDNNNNNNNNEEKKEEKKEELNGKIMKNGHQMNGINGMNGSYVDDCIDDEEITKMFKLDPSEKLEAGMLHHHEIENFSMDEEKLEAGCHPVSWSNCDATSFDVRRGPNYVSGQKAPSKKALYTVFHMDAYKLPSKINKITRYINVDKYLEKYKNNTPYDKDKNPLPPLFILNVMVPDYPPELMGGKDDGEGYQIIMYAHLSQETQEQLNKHSKDNTKLTPAVDLLKRFIHSDLKDRENNELRNRFKCIARIMNPSHTDFGFLANRLVRRYNGRPFLARTSSTFYHEPGKYFATDIDAHVFGYPARQGLSYVKGTIQTAIYDVGVVIEGKTNDELPEQILACCRISKMGVDLCKEFPSKFIKLYKKEMKMRKDRHKKKLQQQQEQQEQQQHNDIEPPQKSKTQQNLHNVNGKRNGSIDKGSKPSKSKSTSNLLDSNRDNNNDNNTQQGSGWGWGMFG